MSFRITLLSLLILFADRTSVFATQAQPVPVTGDQSLTPQIEIAGAGSATLGLSKNRGENPKQVRSGINFSDSALFFGAAQRLGDGEGIGSTGLGWLTLDDTNNGLQTQLFLNQAFLDYQGEKIEFLIGRTDNPTAHLVDFPTIRGDDLITLTNPLNPFSNGDNAEEHRYSNVASVTLNQSLKYFENFHVQHLINSSRIGSQTNINSVGATFEYLGTPGQVLQKVPSYGLGYERFILDSSSSSGLNQIYGGGSINLNESVTNRWTLQVQDIVVFGSGLRNFQNITDSFRGDSNTVSASIRYLVSPFGGLGYQLGLTAGYKNYFNIDQASSMGAALTGVKRLGQGFSLVAQYMGQSRASSLATVQSSALPYEQSLEIGFIFSFDSTINQHLAPRRSLLNQQFQYVPN